jgi:hypothetical protein
MINRVGLPGLVKNLSTNSKSTVGNTSPTYITGRILDIILDENHPDFSTQGEWNSIGTIQFKTVSSDNVGNIRFAKPLYPNIKCFPIINELVVIFLITVPSIINESYTTEYYYMNGVSFWNHPHHNSTPIPFENNLPPSQQLDYQQTEGGLVRRITDGSSEIELNSPLNPSQNTFIERSNIHPLLSFSGDMIYEGRWGNSLRLGSTAKSKSTYKNNWSSNGENGDPITIIRNGQPKNTSTEGWLPITEDVSKDLSSIYLTSTQKIPFSLSNENFISYTTPPISPSQYSNPQIILNSDRIILNAKSDSILISGQNSVGLSSNGSINVESTNSINISSRLINLGDKNASQSILKGDDTVEYLKILINELQNIAEVLKVIQDWPGGVATPNPIALTVANSSLQVFNKIYNQIDDVKSKIVKTV